MPVDADLELWSPDSGKWAPAVGSSSPGLYRTRRFPRRFGYRPAAAGASEALVTDALLGKWLAAIEHGVSLLAYDPESSTLTCALGAQLPGLYGRAATLSSGRPATARADGTVTYADVPQDIAAALWVALKPTGTPLPL
jgi:hypothetical protein